MSSVQPFVIQPDPQTIKQHPTLTRQVRELSEAYEDHSMTVDDKRLQLVGGLLWEVLNLGKQLDLAKEQAGNSTVLPIIIESDDGLVVSLPWETLYHPEYGFLARQPDFTLTRRMPKGKKSLPEPECAPLRVLLFTSLPDDLSEYARLQIEDEQAAVLQTLAAAEQEGRIQLEMPDDGRFDSFQATLQSFKPHVVYFSGHGKFDYEHHNTKAWAIFQFEDKWGKTLEVEENEIRDCLIGSGVQAVVLSACESAKSHKDYTDNGLAQCLHVAGIPHVIGMRESVYDLAGIEFAKAFFAALGKAQSMDQALQQARLAIQAMPKHRSADEHWCLPEQFSQDLSQPLVDWSFEPKPRGQVQSTRESVNGISLPPKFIGRRRELREWQNALRSGEKSECLIVGAGGMGKTALAGKLLDSLKRDGYEVFGLSVRPDEEHDWRGSLSELEQLLKDKFLVKQYQTALGKATTIETPDDLDEPPKVTVDERKRAEALLDGLLRQYDCQFALLIDNLESVQDEHNRQVNNPVLVSWIEAARGFANRGLKLVLTSRWQLPEWGKGSLCVLGQPVFADYVAFIRELNLPVRFMGNAERVREAFEQLGGNYRALTFFAAAAQGMTLGAEQEFLEKLGQAKEEIQVDMAIEQVYEQLDESQREVLNLMRVYLYPVDMEGIQRIALPEYEGIDEVIESLLVVSLLERYWHEGLGKFEYQLPPLVKNRLEHLNLIIPSLKVRQSGALYFLELIESKRKYNWIFINETFSMLKTYSLYNEAEEHAMKRIVSTLESACQYNTLINYWFPCLLEIIDKKNIGVLFDSIGVIYLYNDNYATSMHYFKESLKCANENNDINLKSRVFNSMGSLYDKQGFSGEAIKYFKKSLSLAGNDKSKLLALISLGSYYRKNKNYKPSLDFYAKALVISIKNKDVKKESVILNNIAQIYLVTEDFFSALQFMKKAITVGGEKDLRKKAYFLHNIANIYSEGESEKSQNTAIDYYERSIKISKNIGNNSLIAQCRSNMSRIYMHSLNEEKATDLLCEAIMIQHDIGDKVGLLYSMINMGWLHYYIKNDINSAIKFWRQAYEEAHR